MVADADKRPSAESLCRLETTGKKHALPVVLSPVQRSQALVAVKLVQSSDKARMRT
jgi:hypothetical protein